MDRVGVVQSLNSPFLPPPTGAEPGRAKRGSRIACMRMLRASPFFSPKPGKKPYLEVLSRLRLWRDFLHSDWLKAHQLRGEKLNYNSCTNLLLRKSQNLLFLAPEVQWASKFTVFVRFTFSLNFSNHAHIWYVTWPQ